MSFNIVVKENIPVEGEEYVWFFYKNEYLHGTFMKSYKSLNGQELCRLFEDLLNKALEIENENIK